MAPDVAAVQAVVDAIRAADFPATNGLVVAVGLVNEAIRTVDVPALAAEHVVIDTVVDAIRAVDVPAIQAAIVAIPAVTAKQQGLLGVRGQPPLQEFFQNGANGDPPDASKWVLTVDGDASIAISTGGIWSCNISAGTGAANDAVMRTFGIQNFAPFKEGITSLNFKARFYAGDLSGEFGIGTISATSLATANLWDTALSQMGIWCDNDTVYAESADAVADEQTDLTAYFADATWVTIEIIHEIGVDVKFYINDTLRATHSTRLPGLDVQVAVAAKHTNGFNPNLYAHFIQAWTQ